jgi:hypothetical protein
MKKLKTITNVFIVLAMAGILYLQIYSASKSGIEVRAGFIIMLAFMLSPFIVLLLMSYRLNETEATQPSRIGLFVIAIFTCSITTATYYRITSFPGSSTEAIVFFVLPIYSFIFIAIMYPLLGWLLRLLMQTRKDLRVAIGASAGIALFYVLFSITSEAMNYKNTRNYQKRRLTFNIEEAKKKGVLVKELHHKIDSFNGSLDFRPYIERAFKYGKDTTSFVPLTTTNYPFRLGFNKVFDSSVFVYLMDEELNKFDSSAGSGYHGASGYLVKPVLRDTITLGIRRRDEALGTIKVWN